MRELTLRGILFGAVLTAVFMAANLYMGLKTEMTFASSIPAAISATAVFRLMAPTTLHEANIVQTQASAAGTLCNIILVLPGLVILGRWHGFPWLETSAICGIGGLLGVAYSVPLRRAMVVRGSLPFPEGNAAAVVLKSMIGEEGRARDTAGPLALGWGAAAASSLALLVNGFKLASDDVSGAFSLGGAIFRGGIGCSLALVGVGYLVGIGACLALLLGVALAWGVAVPLFSLSAPTQAAASLTLAADALWTDNVRLIGAGIIAVGSIWTVATLLPAIGGSIVDTLGPRSEAASPEDTDLPAFVVVGIVVVLAFPIGGLLEQTAADLHWAVGTGEIVVATTAIIVVGFLLSAACGYMAGLLGSSSSPISGIGVLSTMLFGVFAAEVGRTGAPGDTHAIAGAALLFASMIVTTCSIANDNLQDLKTGQLVGAKPWQQQVALMIGVVVGAAVIAPLLELLYQAYGFAGSFPREGMDLHRALPAPQAALMGQIAEGIAQHQIRWSLALIGAAGGVVLIGLEAVLRRKGLSLPALTVGIGMYLPVSVVTTIAAGGIIAWGADRLLRARSQETKDALRRWGVLLSSGFLVGESIVGIILAAADLFLGRIKVLHALEPPPLVADALSLALLAVSILCFLAATSRKHPLSLRRS